MTVAAPNSGSFQQQICIAVVALRNAFQTITNLNAYIVAQGGSSFLTGTIGLSSDDAAVVVSTLGNLSALGDIYTGGTPGAALNYLSNSEPLWGGQ